MSKHRPKRHATQEPTPVRLPRPGYQPSKAELEEEFDMPGLLHEEARERFFRPFRFDSSNRSVRNNGRRTRICAGRTKLSAQRSAGWNRLWSIVAGWLPRFTPAPTAELGKTIGD